MDSGSRRYRGSAAMTGHPCLLLRRKAYFRCGRQHVRIDVVLVFCKVLLEHPYQLARGFVEGRFVFPGLHRIEEVWLHPRHRGRHREAEIRIGTEAHLPERAVERAGDERARRFDRHAPADLVDACGPARVPQSAIYPMTANVGANQVAVFSARARQEWSAEKGGELGL